MALLRRRQPDVTEAPRYYIYVSDSKVDMLLSQVPEGVLSRIAAELKVDLKVLSLTLSQQERQENRFTRLAGVLEHLNATTEIGKPDTFSDYFEATMDMRWGVFGEGAVGNEGIAVAFFGGIYGHTVIALTGSPHHVIGAPASTQLRQGIASLGVFPPESFSNVLRIDEPEDVGGSEYEWAETYVKKLQSPLQRLEFVARLLGHEARPSYYQDPLEGCTDLLLGSPLFVAFATR